MNAPITIDTPIAERQAVESSTASRIRIARLLEAQAAHVARMRAAAEVWEKYPRDELVALKFFDALSFCIDADLSDEMEILRHDLRIDREGYPLTDEGDRIPNAERRYVPLKSLERNAA